jgi:hypothetical protein
MSNHLKLHKSTSILTLTNVDVIFQFGSLKGTTHKVRMNNAPNKNFKKYVIGTKKLKNKQKLQFIRTYENMVQF